MVSAALRRLTHGWLSLEGRSVTAFAHQLFLPFLGLLAGTVSAFLGVGGGVIIVPLLIWVLRTPVKQATGVSLASVVLISTVGTITEMFVHASNIRWTTALWLTAGSLLGSWIGGRLIRKLNDRPLRVGLAVILLLATWRLLTTIGTAADTLKPAIAPDPLLVLVVAIGILAGGISVLFGVGGGVVIVPAFLLLIPEMPFRHGRGHLAGLGGTDFSLQRLSTRAAGNRGRPDGDAAVRVRHRRRSARRPGGQYGARRRLPGGLRGVSRPGRRAHGPRIEEGRSRQAPRKPSALPRSSSGAGLAPRPRARRAPRARAAESTPQWMEQAEGAQIGAKRSRSLVTDHSRGIPSTPTTFVPSP